MSDNSGLGNNNPGKNYPGESYTTHANNICISLLGAAYTPLHAWLVMLILGLVSMRPLIRYSANELLSLAEDSGIDSPSRKKHQKRPELDARASTFV
jgi:hypothetical protein